jgi:hypothetical protein
MSDEWQEWEAMIRAEMVTCPPTAGKDTTFLASVFADLSILNQPALSDRVEREDTAPCPLVQIPDEGYEATTLLLSDELQDAFCVITDIVFRGLSDLRNEPVFLDKSVDPGDKWYRESAERAVRALMLTGVLRITDYVFIPPGVVRRRPEQ